MPETMDIDVQETPIIGLEKVEMATSARVKKLDEAFRTAVDRVFKKCSAQAFAAIFPEIPQETIDSAYSQMKDFFVNASEEDFVAIKSKRNVVDKLISLDAMIAKAEANMGGVAGPVGTVTPEQAVRAQGFKTKVEERDLLRKELEELKSTTFSLQSQLGSLRDSVSDDILYTKNVYNEVTMTPEIINSFDMAEIDLLGKELRGSF